jgi:leucyl aminopeptidase
VLGLGKGGDILALAQFSEQLPAGVYRFDDVPGETGGANGALAWLLGTYQFTRYRKGKSLDAKPVPPKDVDSEEVTRISERVVLGHELSNTPPNDMGPEELAAQC